MKNFKEIAEKCLAGELSGTFILRNGDKCLSSTFKKDQGLLTSFRYAEHFYYSDKGHCYISTGHKPKFDIIDFIPDNMQNQIKIDVPEGKVPVIEQTEKGVTITWSNKNITYKQVLDHLNENHQLIQYQANMMVNKNDSDFLRKVNVIGKLINIRNYFGKPKHNTYGHALYYTIERGIHTTPALYPSNDQRVIFDTKEHAEQAIKMLGDELKYLFEPW